MQIQARKCLKKSAICQRPAELIAWSYSNEGQALLDSPVCRLSFGSLTNDLCPDIKDSRGPSGNFKNEETPSREQNHQDRNGVTARSGNERICIRADRRYQPEHGFRYGDNPRSEERRV